MTKREFQWSRNFFILSGALLIGLGVATPFRAETGTLWQMMWMVVVTFMQIFAGFMALRLAKVLHKRAQTTKE